MAENYGGAKHRQTLLEPHQLFSEAPEAWHLHAQPGGGRELQMVRILKKSRCYNAKKDGGSQYGQLKSRVGNRSEGRDRN